MTDIVYATTNPGKYTEVAKLFSAHNIRIHALSDYGINIDVDETGNTLEENAIIKAEAYLSLLPTGTIIVSDDTGIEIDALGGEPGIKVRRWKGYKMSDEEILTYTLERLKGIPTTKRGAQFRTVIAIANIGHATQTFEGKLRGRLLPKPKPIRIEGLPFQPIFFANQYGLMLYEMYNLTSAEKHTKNIITHREHAVINSLPYIKELM